MKTDTRIEGKAPALPFAELVAFTAAVMALNALAIDMMLPALGTIGEALGAAGENDRQLIIIVYVLANGVAQLFFGPMIDRYGRRRVLLWALGGYIVGTVLSVVASSFVLLLAARAFQGVTTAAARVAVIAIVRDQSAGRRMAEVMSLVVTVFMAVPILAPSFGQLVLFVAPWRAIFGVLLVYGVAIAIWTAVRVPETLPAAHRVKLNAATIASDYFEFLKTRQSIGYTLASALLFGALFSYISTSEQIFVEIFKLGARFPLAFAAVAASLGAAALTNARLVSRFGMRRLLHGAVLFFLFSSLVHLGAAARFGDSLPLFLGFMMASFFALGLVGANATALAMEPMGHMAGSAAAANGFAGTTIAGLFGGIVGRMYNGTTEPVIAGFALLSFFAAAVILWTERGRLFGTGPQPDPTG
jgi:DHA1 family bicyclomycin/chloramphenicol resistance-like MFS transporter